MTEHYAVEALRRLLAHTGPLTPEAADDLMSLTNTLACVTHQEGDTYTARSMWEAAKAGDPVSKLRSGLLEAFAGAYDLKASRAGAEVVRPVS